MHKTKIVCTIGPASDAPEMLEKMMRGGMNVARLNMSHGDYAEHEARIGHLKRLRDKLAMPLALMLDTKGPEIRIGTFKDDKPITLVEGQLFTLTTRPVEGNQERVSFTCAEACAVVRPGAEILIDDGLVSLEVVQTDGTDIVCRVVEGGEISNRKSLAVPGVDLHVASLTDADREDILFGLSQGIDLVAASFVNRATDVMELRKFLEKNGGGHVKIISKIESRLGVQNFEEILSASDGIMIARGDLGVEVAMEEVPLLQKRFTHLCNQAAKTVITATQMLDSMMRNARPTRAEVNDVANAILDGTDAVMLSGETASGRYPLEALQVMRDVAEHVESHSKPHIGNFSELLQGGRTVTNAVSFGCYTMALDLSAKAIITPSHMGITPRSVAKYRPECLLVGTTDSESTYHQLSVVWGVIPLRMPAVTDTDEMIDTSVQVACEAGLLRDGDLAVISSGVPVGMSGTTNLIKVHVVGDVLIRGRGIGNQGVTGRVCVVQDPGEASGRFQDGDILVCSMTDNDMMPIIHKAGALIVESDDLLCHAAVVGFALDKPVILDASGQAIQKLKDGMQVSVDPSSGYVYNGEHYRKKNLPAVLRQ